MGTGKYRSPKCIIWSATTLLLTAHTATVAAPNAAIRAACHEDAKRLCADVFGDPDAVRACMRGHHEQLSDKCKATIAEVKRGENRSDGVCVKIVKKCQQRCTGQGPTGKCMVYCTTRLGCSP
jgi:hypothetical protein